MPAMFSEEDFQAESDMRSLQQAAEVRRDPTRLGKARDKAREQLKALRQVAQREARDGETMMRQGFRKLG